MVADAPSLDVVWERDAVQAAALPLTGFDVIVLDAPCVAEARESLRVLGADARLPVLVRLPADAMDAGDEPACLHEAGAAHVLKRQSDSEGDVALLGRIEQLAAQGAPPPDPTRGIIGTGPEMQKVFALIDVAARSVATVLLTGETGTGKELVAQAIHRACPRRGRAFVAINCAAFPDTLLESELFGHARGAFTGADRDRTGLFEEADGGTLFLDEVGETSGPFQAKLLRALQEREVRPLGGTRTRRVDVRVVAATNRELRRHARDGRFREDLYYRLAVFPIELPALRQRRGDVLALARHFLALHGGAGGCATPELSPDSVPLLQAHSWPGNVRELENEMQRAIAMAAPEGRIVPEHFSDRLREVVEPIESQLEPGDTLRDTLGRIEAVLIRRALTANANRRAETARRLGITREGLYKKMKRFGIE
jgi:transcriptional regulator with PAS, ATPase and Fis domain